MILCVTLNPCLDKTLIVPAWRPGAAVRGRAVQEIVGGKGNNVARALTRLGRAARPLTFLGGPTGRHCADLLRRVEGFEPIVVETEAPTRTIVTVRTEGSDEQTAFFDPDPAIERSEAEALLEHFEAALAGDHVEAVVLSGSSPAPATHGLYSDLIASARGRAVPAFLDTYGPALRAIWGFWPAYIQLNRREASQHLNAARADDAAIAGLFETWTRHGVLGAVVTDGPGPVLARIGDRHFRAQPPRVEAVNPVGSGDSFLAGLVDGWLRGQEAEPMLRRAAACGAANAAIWDAGALDPAEVERLAGEVQVEPWEPPHSPGAGGRPSLRTGPARHGPRR
jgi:tagatose 6-phosphate kinase